MALMRSARVGPEGGGEVLLDHTSEHGPRVLRVRGILLMNMTANLKEWGVYDRYLERVSSATRDELQSLIASSWVDIDTAMEHYEVSLGLGIDESRAEVAGERMGDRIGKTFLGLSLRAARKAGLEPLLFVLRRNDRLWDRMYQGGGTRVQRLGSKELLVEDRGNPLFSFEMFRFGVHAYWKTIAGLCCHDSEVTLPQRVPGDGGSLATRFSWR